MKLRIALSTALLALSFSAATAATYYRAAVQAGPFLYVSGQNAQHTNEKLTGNVTEQTKAAVKS
jgi:enamine deaminase RidA (YjgF/YER057c/UK114 family)